MNSSFITNLKYCMYARTTLFKANKKRNIFNHDNEEILFMKQVLLSTLRGNNREE